MTPIRPQPFTPPARPAETVRSDDGRLAAQRAFFAAATGKAPTMAAVVAPSTPAARIPDPAAPSPERILRPGSLLDIRV